MSSAQTRAPSSSGPSFLRRLFARVVALRWLIVALYAVLAIPSAWYAAKVESDSSVERIISPSDSLYQANQAFQKVFGAGEYAVLIIDADEPLSQPVLHKVDALERALSELERVQVSSVVSAFRQARAGFDPQTQAEDLKKYATGTKLFAQQGLIGEDFLTVGMLLEVHNREERTALLHEIDEALARVGTGAPLRAVHRVGTPYVNAYFDAETTRSGAIYTGLFAVFVVVLTLSLYRSARTLLAFLLTLAVCLVLSMGYIGFTGGMFTIVSPMVPMTILITATATLVYLHSRFAERPAGVSVDEHQTFAFSNKFLACTASMFAATVGFAALRVSDIRPIRDMGTWVAVGLFVSWVVVFTLFPALQKILRTPTQQEQKIAAPWFQKLAVALPVITYRWRWPLVIGALLLSAAGVVSIFGFRPWLEPMQPLTSPIEYVSRDEPLYLDTQRARQVLPGLGVTNVWLAGGEDVLLSEPEMLAGLHRFEQALAADDEVGGVIGLPTVLRLVQYAGTGQDAWPTDELALDDLALLFEGVMMKAPGALAGFADRSMAQTQLTVLSHATEHEGYERLATRIREHWQATVAAHPSLEQLELKIVGLGPLQAKMSQSLVPTLTESFALTAAIIFVTFLLVFRSGAARIMTMLPSLFAILVMFLLMRITGMSLNIATILIASTVLGTSENDQIHFFYHFLEGRKTGSVSEALVHTFLVSGRAIFFATVINAGGFLAFAAADMRPMQQFGTLTAVALVLSMVADFTALPAALWIVFREKPDELKAPAVATVPEAAGSGP